MVIDVSLLQVHNLARPLFTMSTRFVSAISICGFSASVGALLGAKLTSLNYEKSDYSKLKSKWKEISIFPVASASSMVIPSNKGGLVNAPPLNQPVNRVSEIMRHGFPSLDQIRSYDNFVLAYDRRTRNAFWVCEHIKDDHVAKNDSINRKKSQFVDDSSIHQFFRATNNDFKNSGFDRGHLAAAANHRYSQKAMDQTFLLSNISPQVGDGFNRDAWNDLEKYVRAKARKHKSVYCCTGPLYLPRKDIDGKSYVKYQVIGQNNVAVPTHFFKVVLIETNSGQFQIMPFLLPNQSIPKNVNIKNFLVPLETIERAAGFLIFDKIPRNNIKAISG